MRYVRGVDACGKLARMQASKSKLHPALALYQKLFAEVASGADVCCGSALHTPSAFVESSIFLARCQAAGIDCPANDSVEFWRWTERIGLTEFAHRLVMAHHRKHGTKPSPMERGAWRLEKHLKRHGLSSWAA